MITDLETLLDLPTFQELVRAINENRDFIYSNKGLKIQAKSSDNGLFIQMAYEQNSKEQAEKEAKDFQNFVESLDDNLFIDVCESLGQEGLSRIVNCLHSEEVETVRSGVLRFKQELREVLTEKINYYTECLNSLDK